MATKEFNTEFGGENAEPNENIAVDQYEKAAESAPDQKEQLDAMEAEFASLCTDTPGVQGAADEGIVSIAVETKPPPDEFFRTLPNFTPTVSMVTQQKEMDTKHLIVAPNMVEALKSIYINVAEYKLWFIVTARGHFGVVPVRQAPLGADQNEWNATKEQCLKEGLTRWVRLSSDRPNGRYRVYAAPAGAFPDPIFPKLTRGQIYALAFKNKDLVIDSQEHPRYLELAALKRDA